MRLFLSVLVLASVAACEKSTAPAEPQSPNLSGNWTGTISSAVAGSGTLALTISQFCIFETPSGDCENELSGTWSATYANPANNAAGSIEGSITQSAVMLDLVPAVAGTCPLIVTAVATDSTSFDGTYSQSRSQGSCTGVDSGTLAAEKL